MEERLQTALELSEEILENIELEKISLGSIALRCLRLARLTNDENSMRWFQYEISGYPKSKTNTLENEAFEIAYSKGRRVEADNSDDKRVFSQLADELEAIVQADELALKSIKTEGVSVAGDAAFIAMRNYTATIIQRINGLIDDIKICKKRITILRGNYYGYVLAVNYELKFSNRVEQVFTKYRTSIDNVFLQLVPDSLRKLDAVYSNLSSTNAESWSQALTTCRRLFEDVANNLFLRLITSESSEYITKTEKRLNITGDKYKNRIFAVLDYLSQKAAKNTLIGSNIIYIIDWIDNLNSTLCKGVHDDITYEEATRGVIQTYICLGDLSIITKEVLEKIEGTVK